MTPGHVQWFEEGVHVASDACGSTKMDDLTDSRVCCCWSEVLAGDASVDEAAEHSRRRKRKCIV